MTRKKIIIYWVIAVLPLIAALIMLSGVANEIPMHYNLNGEITRMGSKYEILLLPLITLFAEALLFTIAAKMSKSSDKGKQNRKVILACGNILGICFLALTVTMIYYTSNMTENIMKTNAIKILGLILSALFILLGNIMPKCKRTEYSRFVVGFRTPWTLRDDDVWNKTNRVCAYYLVAIGVLGIVVSLLSASMWGFLAIISLLLLLVIGGSIYSYLLYKKKMG